MLADGQRVFGPDDFGKGFAMFVKNILFNTILTAIFCGVVRASESLGYVPGELIVRFAPKADGVQRTTAERNTVLAGIDGGTVKRSSKFVPGLSLVELPEGRTVESSLAVFNRTVGIVRAVPNHIMKALSAFPNDPNFWQQWGLHNAGQTSRLQDADIDAPQAWDIRTDACDNSFCKECLAAFRKYETWSTVNE